MPKEYIELGAVRTAYKKSLENNTHKKRGASAIHIQEHNHILHIIDKLPTADVVEVEHGEWVEGAFYAYYDFKRTIILNY